MRSSAARMTTARTTRTSRERAPAAPASLEATWPRRHRTAMRRRCRSGHGDTSAGRQALVYASSTPELCALGTFLTASFRLRLFVVVSCVPCVFRSANRRASLTAATTTAMVARRKRRRRVAPSVSVAQTRRTRDPSVPKPSPLTSTIWLRLVRSTSRSTRRSRAT